MRPIYVVEARAYGNFRVLPTETLVYEADGDWPEVVWSAAVHLLAQLDGTGHRLARLELIVAKRSLSAVQAVGLQAPLPAQVAAPPPWHLPRGADRRRKAA